jgi:fermentation-respiration switch protein FrsA (DUF1100 family)
MIYDPYCLPSEEVLDKELNHHRFTLKEFKSYKFEDFEVTSRYGYKLKGSYIRKIKDVSFKDGKERVVILVHGWTSNRYSMLAYAKIFLNLGFHVFIYDHRNHHLSDKKATSMGEFEADDLQSVVDFAISLVGLNCVIGTLGESMGACCVLIHAGRYHSVDFVSEDCGYHDLKALLYYLCKYNKKLPTWPTLFFANLIMKIKTGTSFNLCSPVKMISSCDDIPMYFAHGDKDDFVPSYMVYKCYDAKPGFKMINIYENSIHARSVVNHKEQYYKDIKEFLEKANII